MFWNGEGWEITTRGDFYAPDKRGLNFALEFQRLFPGFETLERDHCYFFELITHRTKSVTAYEEEDVYLLGARSLSCFSEHSQEALDNLASSLRVKRPRRYSAADVEQCRAMFVELRDDEEGFVIVDRHFNRIKVKQDSYLERSRMKVLSLQELFEAALGVREIDEETLTTPVDLRPQLKVMKEKWERFRTQVEAVYTELKDIQDRKEFAKAACPYPFSSLLFMLKDGKSLESRIPKWQWVVEYMENND